jgi:hypothetical protein
MQLVEVTTEPTQNIAEFCKANHLSHCLLTVCFKHIKVTVQLPLISSLKFPIFLRLYVKPKFMLLQSLVFTITSVEVLIFALIFSPSLVKVLSHTVPELQVTCRLQTDTILTSTSFSSFISNLSITYFTVSRLLTDSLSNTKAVAWQQSVSQLLCKADIKSTCMQFFYLKNLGGFFHIRSSLNVFMT